MAQPSSSSPSCSLLKTLISLEKSLPSVSPKLVSQKRNALNTLRRIKILALLFQELHESPSAMCRLLPSALLCFRELRATIDKAKLLIQGVEERSCIWQVLEHEPISMTFHELSQDMANALDILPLKMLEVSEEVREQVHLVYKQLRRSKPLLDPAVEHARLQFLSYLRAYNERKEDLTLVQLHELFTSLQLNSTSDIRREIVLLENEMEDQAGTGGVTVVSTINNLISFVKFGRALLYDNANMTDLDSPRISCSVYCGSDLSNGDLDLRMVAAIAAPDEFRCPISLELMVDPVVIATGHTYDRSSISKWLESGHCTCPKSGQRLLHVSLIPNHALRRLIQQWCEEHHIPFETDENLVKEDMEDHISSRQAALEATKETAAYLVGKLATGSPEIQRQVAYELRLLAKCGMENRICIAEAGAIPFLVPLLTSSDQRMQENAVTALLNLSICENNKSLIMAAGALEPVVEVVRGGSSMEARENAAATLFSLSVVNDYKIAIGSKPDAIPALLNLMREGSSRGKKDAATALFNLSIFMGNKAKVVQAGAIPLLVDLLTEERAGITDDLLAVLAILAGTSEGVAAIGETKAIPVLVDLLRWGSARGKENSIAVLLALCKSGGEDVIRYVMGIPTALSSVESIAHGGSARAKRKAASLLKLFSKLSLHQGAYL